MMGLLSLIWHFTLYSLLIFGGMIIERKRRPKFPRHEHLWEIVDKQKIEGGKVSLQEAVTNAQNLSKASDYLVSSAKLSEWVAMFLKEGGGKGGYAIHYKCQLCGEEEVKRV